MNSPQVNVQPQQVQNQPPVRNNNVVVQQVEENEPSVPVVQNKRNKKNNVAQQSPCSNMMTKNIILLVVLLLAGLAWHEVIRYYINRTIKCGDGSHQYYVYYAVGTTILGAFILTR